MAAKCAAPSCPAGRALLAALEERARELGATRLVLETGVRQLAALALYERRGFRRVAAWGEYASSPLSVCMELHLDERLDDR